MSRRRQRPCNRSCDLQVDAEAVKSFWAGLSLEEKSEILQFEDAALVNRLWSIRQELTVSDMTCYLYGIRRESTTCMSMFAIEGLCSEGGSLLEAVFFARRSLVERADFFEFLEESLGSPFLQGRPTLRRWEWPSLFEVTPNSWSEFLKQLLQLVELAVAHAMQQVHETAERAAAVQAPTESKWAKRRARKRLAKQKEASGVLDVCPVCDGSQKLLNDRCPLCVDDSQDEASDKEKESEKQDSEEDEAVERAEEETEWHAEYVKKDQEAADACDRETASQEEDCSNLQDADMDDHENGESSGEESMDHEAPADLERRPQAMQGSASPEVKSLASAPQITPKLKEAPTSLEQPSSSSSAKCSKVVESPEDDVFLYEEGCEDLLTFQIVTKHTFLHMVPVLRSCTARKRARSLP